MIYQGKDSNSSGVTAFDTTKTIIDDYNKGDKVWDVNNIKKRYDYLIKLVEKMLDISKEDIEKFNIVSKMLKYIIFTIAFVFTSFFFKELWSHVGNAAIRSMQILLMFSMVIIGAYWYNNHMQYIDFSQVVLMIGFSALASDFCDAILAIYLKSNKLINKYKKNK